MVHSHVPAEHEVPKHPKVDKPPPVRSARTVIAGVSDTGSHGAIGKVKAKAILAALEAAGLEIASKPYVKPVEAKRKDPHK